MKKILKGLLIMLLCITLSIKVVEAKSYIKDLFKVGDKIIVDKKLDGTSFIAGNEVKVEEKIDGIGFIAGNNVKINSEQDYLFIAGNDIVLTNNVNKDLFLIGANIEIKESNIKRDAYIAGDTIDINSIIDRNLYLYGEKIILKGTYNGNITISSNNITIDNDAIIKGTLKYNEDAIVTGLNESVKTKTYKNVEKNESIKDVISNYVTSYIHIVLVGIVLVFCFEKVFKKLQKNKMEVKDVVVTSGKGLLILIGTPIIAIILLMTGLFVSVGIISALLYGILVYISIIISGYILAYNLDKKVFNKNLNNYLLVITGILIIYILKIVPIIGGLISFVSLLYGLGIAGNMILDIKKK